MDQNTARAKRMHRSRGLISFASLSPHDDDDEEKEEKMLMMMIA